MATFWTSDSGFSIAADITAIVLNARPPTEWELLDADLDAADEKRRKVRLLSIANRPPRTWRGRK